MTTVAHINEGRLSWPLSLPKKCRALDNMSEQEREEIFTMAAEFLWRWTGQRFGVGEVLTHPRLRDHRSSSFGSTFAGRGPTYRPAMAWPGSVAASELVSFDDARVILVSPREILEVTLDGVPMDPAEYHLVGSSLYRLGGSGWPQQQSPSFTVRYTSGNEVPKGGQIATGVLACEFAMAVTNDPNCSLPQRLQSVTREGITMTVMDQFEDLDEGRTGIWLIDNWVSSIIRSPRGSSVMSPENSRWKGLR